MAPISSLDRPPEARRSSDTDPPALSAAARITLLDVARRSVEHAVRAGTALLVDTRQHPPELRVPRASFVSLHRGGSLRGCIGELEPRHPLLVAVAETAASAALRDPRFPPLGEDELAGLGVEVSVLSPLTELPAQDEAQLLARLRPAVDGLVLLEHEIRATFLPGVWQSLPQPADFVAELKHKAGLARPHWSPDLRFRRFTVETIP